MYRRIPAFEFDWDEWGCLGQGSTILAHEKARQKSPWDLVL